MEIMITEVEKDETSRSIMCSLEKDVDDGVRSASIVSPLMIVGDDVTSFSVMNIREVD